MNPFAINRRDSIATCGESKLLRNIKAWLGASSPAAPYGMGDDVAVLPPREQPSNLLTIDSVVFGRHFDAAIAPEEAGAKLLKRNLSDIAAMGGYPREGVTSLLLPSSLSVTWLERFVRGLAACAQAWDVALVGGDLTQTDDFLGASLSLTGYAKRPMLRTGAATGDVIWVTGELGGSILRKHVTFTPRIHEGRFLAESGIVGACIDLSDGLAKDLPALLPEGTQARLNVRATPVAPDANSCATASGKDPLFHAFCDGEDYELLFITHPSKAETLSEEWSNRFPNTKLTQLGIIALLPENSSALCVDATSGINLIPEQCGYEHFSAPA